MLRFLYNPCNLSVANPARFRSNSDPVACPWVLHGCEFFAQRPSSLPRYSFPFLLWSSGESLCSQRYTHRHNSAKRKIDNAAEAT
jgi:hypothetical protein